MFVFRSSVAETKLYYIKDEYILSLNLVFLEQCLKLVNFLVIRFKCFHTAEYYFNCLVLLFISWPVNLRKKF